MPDRFYTRRFLNQRGHHAGAYVLASVEDTSSCTGTRTWSCTEFTVTDCNRQIRLAFSAEPRALANSLHKIDVLLATLTSFRAALEAEGRLAAERAERARAEKAAKKAAKKATKKAPGPLAA